MTRAHMKDEAYRVVIQYVDRDGEPQTRNVGPYATIGAARGQATSQANSIKGWGMGGKVLSSQVQRATGWEDVS